MTALDVLQQDVSQPPHPLFERMLREPGFADVSAQDFESFSAQPGPTVLFFSEDPARYRETLDLAVILPEIARAFAGRFRVGALLPETARAMAVRFGVRRWPALVVLRDGDYVGAIEGLRNWDEYCTEVAHLLAAPASRPPSIGIAVKAAGQDDRSHCG